MTQLTDNITWQLADNGAFYLSWPALVRRLRRAGLWLLG